MNETELKPKGNREYSADEIVEHILVGASRFRMYHSFEKPTVFMSRDIMAVLAKSFECWRPANFDYDITMVCGYNVKFAEGKNVLYMGFDLL